jgi:hypothetical protein
MPETPDQMEDAPVDVQRTLMDRARRLAERQDDRLERPLLPRLVGFALALAVVVVVLFAFDRFLTAMQHYLDLPVAEPERAPAESIPAYVVPLDPGEGETPSGEIRSPTAGEASQARDPSQDGDEAQPGGN